MRILVVGANGQLGRCLVDRLELMEATECIYRALTCADLDITNGSQVLETVKRFSPDFIFNAAAYTAVDKAESEQEKAYLVNEIGVKNLAMAATAVNAWLIHVSTDYVFDGSAVRPYLPDSPTTALGVYGASKLAGEVAAMNHCSQCIILRTSWVFSEHGNNFVKTMIRLANEREEVSVVADQYGCPTYAGHLADAMIAIASHTKSNLTNASAGIYHVSGGSPTSWHGFARAIFQLAFEAKKIKRMPNLFPIPSSQFPTPVTRPAYSVLHNDKTLLNVSLQGDWLAGLDYVLCRLP